MKKISFIGCYDKIDFMLYIAKILVAMDKKVLVVDNTINQKAKYIVPVIKPTKAYVTEFEKIDVAVGFNNFNEIKEYLGISIYAELPYDIVMEIALKYRPHEVNCYNPVQGKGLYIYDLSSGIHKQKNKVDDNIITKYDVKAIPISKLFYFSSTELLKMYNKKIKRLFNYKKN